MEHLHISHNKKLPEMFRPLLWSHRFESVDPARDRQAIIVNAVNYGSLVHWRWLLNTYGKAEVRRVLLSIPATALRTGVQRLAALLFDLPADAPHRTH